MTTKLKLAPTGDRVFALLVMQSGVTKPKTLIAESGFECVARLPET